MTRLGLLALVQGGWRAAVPRLPARWRALRREQMPMVESLGSRDITFRFCRSPLKTLCLLPRLLLRILFITKPSGVRAVTVYPLSSLRVVHEREVFGKLSGELLAGDVRVHDAAVVVVACGDVFRVEEIRYFFVLSFRDPKRLHRVVTFEAVLEEIRSEFIDGDALEGVLIAGTLLRLETTEHAVQSFPVHESEGERDEHGKFVAVPCCGVGHDSESVRG